MIADDSGMDFRSMLKKKRYGKWDDGDEEPDWGNLKAVEKEVPQLKKVEKVSAAAMEEGQSREGTVRGREGGPKMRNSSRPRARAETKEIWGKGKAETTRRKSRGGRAGRGRFRGAARRRAQPPPPPPPPPPAGTPAGGLRRRGAPPAAGRPRPSRAPPPPSRWLT